MNNTSVFLLKDEIRNIESVKEKILIIKKKEQIKHVTEEELLSIGDAEKYFSSEWKIESHYNNDINIINLPNGDEIKFLVRTAYIESSKIAKNMRDRFDNLLPKEERTIYEKIKTIFYEYNGKVYVILFTTQQTSFNKIKRALFNDGLYIDICNNKYTINGDLFYCSPLQYDKVEYEMQYKRIRSDKAKHEYLRKYHNVETLYLWEYDINNDLKKCKELIKLYIENKGILENYNSFNYELINEKLCLTKEIIKIYIQWDKKKLLEIVDLSIKQKPDYYVEFQCETCNKTVSRLKSKYDEQEHHFCSKKCKGKYNTKINTIVFKCDECGKEIKRGKAEYNNTATHFCSKECHDKFQTTSEIRKCDNCEKEILVSPKKLKNNKHFFCSQQCNKEYKKIHKEEYIHNIEFECDQCGAKKQVSKSQYNSSKNHFCSKRCQNLFQKGKHRNKLNKNEAS